MLAPHSGPMDGHGAQICEGQFERRFSGIGEALSISGQAERKQRLSQYFGSQSLKAVGDHAPRCYATKIWNAI